jgi:hypothetical protein
MRVGSCLQLLPLTFRQAVELARTSIPADRHGTYLEELRRGLQSFDHELIFRPFGFATALRVFLERGALPADDRALLEGVLRGRFARNRRRVHLLDERLRDVPDDTVREVAQQVAFELRVVRQRASVEAADWNRLVADAMKDVRARDVFGTSALSEIDALALLRHYELMETTEQAVRLSHDLVADSLAAARLALKWRDHVSHLRETTGEDAWRFAAPHVPEADREAFLDVVFAADPVLAAQCARAMGAHAPSLLEPKVFDLETRASDLALFQASSAMAILRTPACIERLRQRLATKPETSTAHYQALRALVPRPAGVQRRALTTPSRIRITTRAAARFARVGGPIRPRWRPDSPALEARFARRWRVEPGVGGR